MNTNFTLKELFEVYHDKCKELDRVMEIKDLLVDQNEKLIENTLDSIHLENQIDELKNENEKLKRDLKDLGKNRNVHLNRKLKLYEERIELNLIIEDLKAECSELRRDLDRERSFDRTKQAYRDTLKNTNIESNRFEPSPHVRWDDYNTGG
ncbi:hypothetical protein UFOVP1071_57 [uncultured Caudovirales phage]|uniref:Uncharacterized protein n=1 Tax=uncultured Caudovirales phage TaxID=2100421 RepID=A0A6J5QH84_9CAUD|nr:hypothetical protein UFOVP1071_57 [uncultured Caudovirales phage]